jgi:heat shock protein HslJ
MLRYLTICLFIVACAGSRDGSNNSDEPLKGEWQLALFPYSSAGFAEIFGQHKPTLQFLSGKRVAGSTGCNEINGTYNISGDKMFFSKLVKRNVSSCSYNENVFLNALSQTNRYEIEDSRLELLKDTIIIMVFAKR